MTWGGDRSLGHLIQGSGKNINEKSNNTQEELIPRESLGFFYFFFGRRSKLQTTGNNWDCKENQNQNLTKPPAITQLIQRLTEEQIQKNLLLKIKIYTEMGADLTHLPNQDKNVLACTAID